MHLFEVLNVYHFILQHFFWSLPFQFHTEVTEVNNLELHSVSYTEENFLSLFYILSPSLILLYVNNIQRPWNVVSWKEK